MGALISSAFLIICIPHFSPTCANLSNPIIWSAPSSPFFTRTKNRVNTNQIVATMSRTIPQRGISRRRSSTSLSSSMSDDTLSSLSSLGDKPGLAFYTSYGHVKDVAAHLRSVSVDGGGVSVGDGGTSIEGKDVYSLHTLASCTLSSTELLLALMYRSDTSDFRPGVDKTSLGLLVCDIVGSFVSLMRVGRGLSEAKGFELHQRDDSGSGVSDATSTTSSSASFLPRLANASALGLLSSSTKSALRSVLTLLDEIGTQRCIDWNKEQTILDTINELRKMLDMTPTNASYKSSDKIAMSYSQCACNVSERVLRSHQAPDGSLHPSPHGPEDLMFQVPHVILEHYFWYIENILFSQIRTNESGGWNTQSLILVTTIHDVCTKVIGLLDLMILADFHPLRVSVHGSSGFYSEAFHRIRAWYMNVYRATSTTMNLDQLHLCPELYPEETLFLERMDRASAAFRTFAFRHYALAQRTIGSNSMGSAGKTFEQMQGAFLHHPNRESNTSKYRTHEYTNVKYASFIGLGTQCVSDSIKGMYGSNISFNTFGFSSGESPVSDNMLKDIEECFVKGDVNGFVELFNTSNCRIEHPPGTLPYLGTKVRAYFMNMIKRHPVFHAFRCTKLDGDQITIDVKADLFEGTTVEYQMKGSCLVNNDGSSILRLVLEGMPDMNKELCESQDQRVFHWQSDEDDYVVCNLQESFRRPLAPAEILAYELNQNKSGKDVSDGLTIVARSIVIGSLPSKSLVQVALDQVARRNTLLTARVELTEEGLYFVANNNDEKKINLRVMEGDRFDCIPHLNTQFNCDEGDMIRVIATKLVNAEEPTFEIVTIIFHGICDAISVRDLHSQIIQRMSLVAAIAEDRNKLLVLNEKCLPRTIALPTAHYAKIALAKRTSPAADPLPLPDPAPINSQSVDTKEKQLPKSMTIRRKFTAAETKALLEACKRHNSTVHAAIGAASLLAADCGESTKRVLTSAVDMRRRLGQPTSELVYSVGGFDGSAAFEYDISEYKAVNDGFWMLSQLIREDIVESIDSGRLLSTYTTVVEGLVGAYKAGYLDGGCFGTVFLSNIGNESYVKNIGANRWCDFEYIYGQFLPGGAHYHITCSTFDDCLTLNFQYVFPTIAESSAVAFVDATVEKLTSGISY